MSDKVSSKGTSFSIDINRVHWLPVNQNLDNTINCLFGGNYLAIWKIDSSHHVCVVCPSAASGLELDKASWDSEVHTWRYNWILTLSALPQEYLKPLLQATIITIPTNPNRFEQKWPNRLTDLTLD